MCTFSVYLDYPFSISELAYFYTFYTHIVYYLSFYYVLVHTSVFWLGDVFHYNDYIVCVKPLFNPLVIPTIQFRGFRLTC